VSAIYNLSKIVCVCRMIIITGDTYDCSSRRQEQRDIIVTWMANTFHYWCRLLYIYIMIWHYIILFIDIPCALARHSSIDSRLSEKSQKKKKSERNGMHNRGQICRNVWKRKKTAEYIILYCLVCRCRRQRRCDGRRLTADRAGKYILFYSLYSL